MTGIAGMSGHGSGPDRVPGRQRRRRGHGSIFRDRDGWIARVTLVDGRRIRRRAPTYPAAKSRLAELVKAYRDELGSEYRKWRPKPNNRPGVKPRVRFRILQRDGFRCHYCGAGPEQDRLVVDHVVPVAKGGSDDDDNLVTACATCNSGKADLELESARG